MSHVQNFRDLWVAVLLRAIVDASRIKSPIPDKRKVSTERAARRRALSWIVDCGPDFREVCDRAGFDANAITKIAREGRLDEIIAAYRMAGRKLDFLGDDIED